MHFYFFPLFLFVSVSGLAGPIVQKITVTIVLLFDSCE